MSQNLSLPPWLIWLLALFVGGFVVMAIYSVRRTNGIKRSYFASPYTLWMILFTNRLFKLK